VIRSDKLTEMRADHRAAPLSSDQRCWDWLRQEFPSTAARRGGKPKFSLATGAKPPSQICAEILKVCSGPADYVRFIPESRPGSARLDVRFAALRVAAIAVRSYCFCSASNPSLNPLKRHRHHHIRLRRDVGDLLPVTVTASAAHLGLHQIHFVAVVIPTSFLTFDGRLQ
jgi:hypothetical protein